jgi:peptidoglycan/xylan/chitin deacetylase (PgdA/CDA1 family)
MRKLYIFNNTAGKSTWNSCYSIADDGAIIGNHTCSHEDYMKYDLHDREDRLEDILKHFNGEPYELELVSGKDVLSHAGLLEALRLNEIAGEKANQYEKAGVTLEFSNE